MNRAEKRRQKKLAEKATRKAKPGTPATGAIGPSARPTKEAFDLALHYYNAGRLPETERTCQQTLQIDPNQPVVLHLQGVIARQTGKYDASANLINKALAIEPGYADAHHDLGLALNDLGKYEEAAQSYQRALAIKPELADAHYNLGNVLNRLGRLEEAAQSYTNALANKPHFLEAFSNLGSTLKDLGRLDEAVTYFDKALDINPGFAEIHNNLGVALYDLGRHQEAAESYKKAIAIMPSFAEAHSNLGNVFKEQGNMEEALASINKALAIKPDFADAHFNLGNVFKKLEKYEEAAKSYQKATALKPDFADAHYNLGIVLKESDRLDEAVENLKAALIILPRFEKAEHVLNSLLGNTSDCAPKNYVEDLFDPYAEKFEKHLINDLEYSAPSLIKKTLVDLGLVKGKFGKVIDLGCGTGLAGVQFADIAESLVGIDLSDNMIRKAKEKNIYTGLYVDDIVDGLENLNEKFDVFISTDVFIYIGNLLPIFKSVKKHFQKQSIFTFCTEHAQSGDFVLQKTCRYAHSKDYVESVAKTAGLQVTHSSQFDLRKENDNWVAGGIYVLRSV